MDCITASIEVTRDASFPYWDSVLYLFVLIYVSSYFLLQTIQESMKSRQPKLDAINENMARYRRESKLDGNQVPKSLEVKVKELNDNWSRIASLTANMFARLRSPRSIVEEKPLHCVPVHSGIPMIIEGKFK